MFGKENWTEVKTPKAIQTEYIESILYFMRAIISNPQYEFRQEDKKKYYDSLNQVYSPKMKYELTVLEATRYADAFISRSEI